MLCSSSAALLVMDISVPLLNHLSAIIDVSLSHSSIVYLPIITLHLLLSSPVSLSSSSPSAAAQLHQQYTLARDSLCFHPPASPLVVRFVSFLFPFSCELCGIFARLIGLYHTVFFRCFVLLIFLLF